MIKQSYIKNLKKKIMCFVVAIGLLLGAFAGLSVGSKDVFAYNVDITSSYINDATFTSYSGSAPYAPTSWTRITGQGKYNSEDMVGGIFNSNSTTDSYLKKYMVLANPGVPTTEKLSSSSSKYYSLSLSAPYSAGGNFGYTQSSSSLNLSKNSFYAITITLKTITSDNREISDDLKKLGYADYFDTRASMYLSGFSDSSKDAKFEMVESQYGKALNNGWGEYTFYIATNEFTAESSLKLELWLGSKTQSTTGTVFFNEIEVKELDSNSFDNVTENYATTAYKNLIDLRDNTGLVSVISNPTFETDWNEDWSLVSFDNNKAIIGNVDTSSFGSDYRFKLANLDELTDLSGKNLRSKDNGALFIANTEDTYTAIQTKNDINIKRQTYYKLSVWAWSNSSASTAPTLKLVNTTEDRTLDSATITVATNCTKGSNSSNGWVEYSFYIYGDAYIDTTCKLQICLGSDTTKAGGYVYIDDLRMREISYSQYTSGSSESNSTTFNYNQTNSDYSVANHDFNITENKTNSNTFPLAPASWTYEVSESADKTTLGGVVNTNSALFNVDDLAINGSKSAYNPGSRPDLDNDANNNVLMMGSIFKSTQSYTSTSFSLSEANSYYSISFYINARQGGAGFKIYNMDGYIASVKNIKTNGWTKFTTLVKLSTAESDYAIEFSLDNEGTDAKYAYFDNVVVENVKESIYTDTSANDFTPNVYGSSFVTKIDREKYNFENDITDESFANGFTENEKIAGAYNKISNVYSAHSGNNALVLHNNNGVNGEYYVKTNRALSVKSGSYYKVSLWAKTFSLNGDGAFLEVSGSNFSERIKEIYSNGWTEYNFYIQAKTDSSVTLNIGFLKDTNGYIIVDDISLEQLTCENEEAFNTIVNNLDTAKTKKVTINADSTDDDNTTDDTTDDSFTGSFNWYVVTALVTSLAIILAVVGTLLRKVNWKRSKKVKTSYDRAKTLDKDLDRRERIALRQQQISELEAQLQEIEETINKIKAEAEEQERIRHEENEKIKAEITARKNTVKAEREQALKERNEKIAKDKNAFTAKEEEEFNAYIKKLERSEQKEQLELNKHEKKVNAVKDKNLAHLEKYLARQEFIKAEIARIDAEIEEIAREEAQIWEEYRQAKAEAKQRKAEYKASLKEQKEKEKLEREKNKAKKAETKNSDKSEK